MATGGQDDVLFKKPEDDDGWITIQGRNSKHKSKTNTKVMPLTDPGEKVVNNRLSNKYKDDKKIKKNQNQNISSTNRIDKHPIRMGYGEGTEISNCDKGLKQEVKAEYNNTFNSDLPDNLAFAADLEDTLIPTGTCADDHKVSYNEYMRLLVFLHEAGLFILRAILMQFIKLIKCENVDMLLKPFKSSLRKEMDKETFKTVFPKEEIKTDIEKWDIKLLVSVLLHCCTLEKILDKIELIDCFKRKLHTTHIDSFLQNNKDKIEAFRYKISDHGYLYKEILFPADFSSSNVNDWSVDLLLHVLASTCSAVEIDSTRKRMREVIDKHRMHKERWDMFLGRYKARMENKKGNISNIKFKQIFPEYENPNLEKWDIDVVFFVVLCMFETLRQSTINGIKKIRELRNDISHPSSLSMKKEEFDSRWAEMYKTFEEIINIEIPSKHEEFRNIARRCRKDKLNLDNQDVINLNQESQNKRIEAAKDVEKDVQSLTTADVNCSIEDKKPKVVQVEFRVLASTKELEYKAEKRIRQLLDNKDESVRFIVDKFELIDIREGCVILVIRYFSVEELIELIKLVCSEEIQANVNHMASKIKLKEKVLVTASLSWNQLKKISRDVDFHLQEESGPIQLRTRSTTPSVLSHSIEVLTNQEIKEGFERLSIDMSKEFGDAVKICPMLSSHFLEDIVLKGAQPKQTPKKSRSMREGKPRPQSIQKAITQSTQQPIQQPTQKALPQPTEQAKLRPTQQLIPQPIQLPNTQPTQQPIQYQRLKQPQTFTDLQSEGHIWPDFSKKKLDSTIPLLDVKVLGEWSDSICQICYPGGSGTGFRVGPNYIMTAKHVVDDIMSQEYPNVAESRKQSRLGIVYALFGFLRDGDSVNRKNIFYFDENVHFSNDNVDTAILELKPHHSLEHRFPKPFTNFSIPKCNKSFYLIGHLMGGKKVMEKVEHIVELSLEKKKIEIDTVQKLCRDTYNSEYDNYNTLTRPHRYLFQCIATKGASGSPGLVVLPDGRAVVVTMLLCGYPDLYNDPQVGQQIKEKYWCVEQGISMDSIHNLMKVENRELCRAIFGEIDEYIPSRGPIAVESQDPQQASVKIGLFN